MAAGPFDPIPTNYGGMHFPSRTEASWAVVFDALGECYRRQPSDLIGVAGINQRPDYFLEGLDSFMEVKGDEDGRVDFGSYRARAQTYAQMVADRTGKTCLLAFGSPGHCGDRLLWFAPDEDEDYQTVWLGRNERSGEVYLAANPAPEERRAINRAIGLLAGNRWVGGPRLPMIPLMDEADDDDPFAVEDDPATIRRAAALARWRVRRLARWDAKHGGQWPDEGVFA